MQIAQKQISLAEFVKLESVLFEAVEACLSQYSLISLDQLAQTKNRMLNTGLEIVSYSSVSVFFK